MKEEKKYSPERKIDDSKRGVFTSHNLEESRPVAQPYLESSIGNSLGGTFVEGLKSSYQHTSHQPRIKVQVPHHRQHIHSSYTQQVPSNIHLGLPQSVHIKPPHSNFSEVNFNYSTSQAQKQSPIKYMPIPNQQVEVRRTYVPNKIYNYIPVNSTSGESQPDEAYDVLLKEYEKLYEKFEEESKHKESLLRELQQLQKIKPSSQTQNYSLNVRFLHDKLSYYYEQYVNDLVNLHKQRSADRIKRIFEEASRQIQYTHEEVSYTSSY